MPLPKTKRYCLFLSLLIFFCFDAIAGKNDFLQKVNTPIIRNRVDSFLPFSRRFCSSSFNEAIPPKKHSLLVKGATFAFGFVGGGSAAYWWAKRSPHKGVENKKLWHRK